MQKLKNGYQIQGYQVSGKPIQKREPKDLKEAYGHQQTPVAPLYVS